MVVQCSLCKYKQTEKNSTNDALIYSRNKVRYDEDEKVDEKVWQWCVQLLCAFDTYCAKTCIIEQLISFVLILKMQQIPLHAKWNCYC